jgi:N-acetylglucosaminyl-diphospho-decaprenol L-rhamnosyltransferase
MSTSIDVVVVAYNPYELTARCLHRLREQTAPHHLIVVDNGSTDDTRARLATDWPEAHVERLPVGCGFAKACNLGAAAGSSEVVVLINNDVECRPDFLEHLAEPIAQDQRVGAVAALLLQPGERLIDSAGLVADRTLASFPRLQGLPVAQSGRERPALVGPTGAAAAYRRRTWEQLDGLDETIFAYMEDLDLDLRLRSRGWKAAMAPEAVGVHLGSATHRHRSAAQRRYGGFGRGYLIRRYGLLHRLTGPRTILTETIVVLGDLMISRDLAALRGRLEGWRAGRGRPRLPLPPSAAIDTTITFLDSLALRRAVYAGRAA